MGELIQLAIPLNSGPWAVSEVVVGPKITIIRTPAVIPMAEILRKSRLKRILPHGSICETWITQVETVALNMGTSRLCGLDRYAKNVNRHGS